MCLIALDWRPGFLRVASNRDEVLDRPAQPAHVWEEEDGGDNDDNHNNETPQRLYAGKDLTGGGSWLAVSSNGKFAALTNFHSERDSGHTFPKSRGHIVIEFCRSQLSPKEFAKTLEAETEEYGGFSAFLFDGTEMICCSNRDPKQFARELAPGIYGLSNHLLDTPWVKVLKSKEAMQSISSSENILSHEDVCKVMMAKFEETRPASENSADEISTTMEGFRAEVQEALFVRIPAKNYGTRTTTIVTFDEKHGFEVTEKNHKTPHAEPSLTYQQIQIKEVRR